MATTFLGQFLAAAQDVADRIFAKLGVRTRTAAIAAIANRLESDTSADGLTSSPVTIAPRALRSARHCRGQPFFNTLEGFCDYPPGLDHGRDGLFADTGSLSAKRWAP